MLLTLVSRQHLYRRHALCPLKCEIHHSTFDSLDDMRNHSMEHGCKVDNFTHIDGFDRAQEKQLKRRKVPKPKENEDSEEVKWRHIFMILFPDSEEIPSPCKNT
jgi:hypothetical protein